VQFESGRRERWAAIIGEGTTHGTTIAADDRRFGIGAAFHLTLQGAHTAYRLFEYFLGMPVRFVHGLGGFTERMDVTELMRDLG
jgi:hypothetical protein